MDAVPINSLLITTASLARPVVEIYPHISSRGHVYMKTALDSGLRYKRVGILPSEMYTVAGHVK
jgi:hypothetical protein